MHTHSPRPCITMDGSKKADQRGALWRAGPGTQEATGQLWMTDAKQAFIGYRHLVWGLEVPQELRAACPGHSPCPVPSTTPATAQTSLGARKGHPGDRGIGRTEGRATSPWSLLHRPRQSRGRAERAGPESRASQGCSPRTALCKDSQEALSGPLITSPAMAAAPFYGQTAQEV